LSDKPIQFIINTGIGDEHTGGNGALAKAGLRELSGAANDRVAENAAGATRAGASIVAYINALNRMDVPDGNRPALPKENWPTDPYDTSVWKIFNDETIVMYHAPAAHTDGDTFVFFRRSDVVSTGDIFVPYRYPVIDEERGGSIDGVIDALNNIIDDVLFPRENEEGGTYVIPGHGRVCDRSDVVNYRDMLTIIRAQVEELVKNGKTLPEVIAAKPTFGFDGLYGAETGPWTTSMFVKAVYDGVTKDKKHR
jgi:glyoxylase-like metal-dependent hydrolase (beta-lactamase superfamily II)